MNGRLLLEIMQCLPGAMILGFLVWAVLSAVLEGKGLTIFALVAFVLLFK